MKQFTKSFLVLLAALFSFSLAFAETGTETEKNATGGGSSNAQVDGQSYYIAGGYIAGTGSAQTGNMTSKGFKLRTGTDGNRAVFTVNENYTITSLSLEAASNYAKKEGAETNTKVIKVEVDGVEVGYTGGEDFQYRGESGATSCNLTIEGIAAKETIAIYFDNSGSAGSQLNASWVITWERPDATQPTITVTPAEVALVPGATYQLSSKVDPNSFTTQWVSDNAEVATVSETGLITAVAPGKATVSLQWTDDASVAASVVVTVAEFDPSAYTVTAYDFTVLGDVTLTIGSDAVGAIWNEGNSKPNNVFFCTNEGLENIAVQAVLSSNKGWSIKDGEGLVLASGAGRCAAVGNLKAGQIVEIFYTGDHFYTGSKDDAVRKDDGAPKTALNEGVGRAIYKMDEDGLLGFELDKGKAVTKINVYSPAAATAQKTIGLIPGVWETDGAIFAAYVWNEDGNAWFPFAAVGEAYATQIPDSYTGLIVARINPDGTDPDPWKNVWNQTADIDFTTVADKSVITITGWEKTDYTISAPVDIDIDALKAALEKAIADAKILNIYANDADLATAIAGAEAALADGDATAMAATAVALEAAATNAAKGLLTKAVTLADTFGIDASALQAVLDKEDATIEDMLAALTAFAETTVPAAKEALAQAKSFFATFDKTAAEALAADFAAAEEALDGTDINAMISAAQTLMYDAMPAAKTALEKVLKYVALIDDATLNADAAAIATAMEANNLQGVITAANQMKEDFPTAVMGYITKVEEMVKAGEAAGSKGVDELKTAVATAKAAIVAAGLSKDIVAMGEAVRNLVLAVEAYIAANTSYTVAGTKDLTGTENDWDVAEANNMTLTDGLYTWTAEGITISNEAQPQFKVVKTTLEGQTWYPEGDGSTNWVITPEVVGGEGVYNITITFNPETAEISVTGKNAAEPETIDITISPDEGDIAEALADAEVGIENIGNITINLTEGVTYTVSTTLEAHANFEIQANGATIDASALEGNLIEMAYVEAPEAWTAIEYVSIHNATVKGLKKALFYSGCKNYDINWLTIDNSVIELAADATTIDFTKGSVARNFNVENSTIYAPTATTKAFYSSQSGQKATEAADDAIQSFIFKSSTLYNLVPGKNFFTHRQNSQKWLKFDVENNIFVNCGKSGQVIKGMNGGGSSANPTFIVKGNAFNFEGADTSEKEETGDADEPIEYSVAGVVTFTDAANGDFSGTFELAEGATAPETLGDPYWTITFVAAPIAEGYYLVGNMTDWAAKSVYKMELNEGAEGVEEYMINVNLEADAQFKVVKVQDNAIVTWYPDGEGNNYGQNGELTAAGNYNVYFRPNADGGDDWFNKIIYVADANTDGISFVTIGTENAVVYDMQGRRVVNAQKGLYIVNGKKVVKN